MYTIYIVSFRVMSLKTAPTVGTVGKAYMLSTGEVVESLRLPGSSSQVY